MVIGGTLIISRGEEFSFWDVETFQPVLRLPRDVTPYPGGVAFSADGRLMALEMAPGVLHLKAAASGRTVARLEDPHGDRATWQGFTPDGTRLVVASGLAGAVHVWDLRAIRERLKAMDLDWDWPEFPPAATGNAPGAPVAVEVIRGDQAEATLTPEERARKAIEHWRHELQANPGSAALCNRLAWTYLTVPEPLRDVKAAVSLAEKAVQRAPATTEYRNTLGTAYYRAGRYREAVGTLRPNLERPEEENLAFALCFRSRPSGRGRCWRRHGRPAAGRPRPCAAPRAPCGAAGPGPPRAPGGRAGRRRTSLVALSWQCRAPLVLLALTVLLGVAVLSAHAWEAARR